MITRVVLLLVTPPAVVAGFVVGLAFDRYHERAAAERGER